ncbi:MAG TPA: hypothetical protein VF742_06025, partial [Terracidiphilus sp.]
MIRLFNVHFPVRTLVLLVVEALVIMSSFVLGSIVQGPQDRILLLTNELFIEGGLLKILAITVIVLLVSHGLDLYDSASLGAAGDQTFRLFVVLSVVAFCLAGVDAAYDRYLPGRVFLPGLKWGLVFLAVTLLGWRAVYSWLVRQPYFRERVYVLGTGVRAERLMDGLRQRPELGIEVVGWTGQIGAMSEELPQEPQRSVGNGNRLRDRSEWARMSDAQAPGLDMKVVVLQNEEEQEKISPLRNGEAELKRAAVANHLLQLVRERGVHRVIVAMEDRRGALPMEELLQLRLDGVKVEEATSWLEKIYGRIEVENLNPSGIIFAEGFRFSSFFRLVRRVLNFSVALIGLVLSIPLIP